MNNFTYTLILDTSNNRVLCSAENPTIAMATVMAFSNVILQSFMIYGPLPNLSDFDTIDKRFIVVNNWKIEETSTIDSEWDKFRNQVIFRKIKHRDLYQWIDYHLPFTNDNMLLSDNIAYLIDQLNKSDPKTNTYKDAIMTYASITNCSPETAYNELWLLIDGQGQRKNRLMSLYIKYRDLLNLAPNNASLDELTKIVDQAKVELLENSYV